MCIRDRDYRLTNKTTGIEAITRLRELYKIDIPSILISGDTEPELIDDVKRHGFYMLHKPIKANKLRTIISILMSESQKTS